MNSKEQMNNNEAHSKRQMSQPEVQTIEKEAESIHSISNIQQADFNSPLLTPVHLLQLQRTAGNHVVAQTLKQHRSNNQEGSAVQRLLSTVQKHPDRYTNSPSMTIQCKFKINQVSGTATDLDNNKQYTLIGENTVEGRKVWKVKDDTDTIYYIDKQTNELIDDNGSLFSEEWDDEKELTPQEQLNILIEKGSQTKKKVYNKRPTTHELDEPAHRKIIAIERSEQEQPLDQVFSITGQNIRISHKKGHFITPGGNKEYRKTISEPDADYKTLLERTSFLAKDDGAKSIYNISTGGELKPCESFTDPEVAAMCLYFMNNKPSITTRNQLSENLSKFAAITTISERARGFEATRDDDNKPIPYDASLLIKAGLKKVIQNETTLEKMFYDGENGKDSIFIGAPSMNKELKIPGGSEKLRRPFDSKHSMSLEKQMSIFPKTRREMAKLLNSVRSNSKTNLTLSEDQSIKLKIDQIATYKERSNALKDKIKNRKIPSITEANDFLNDKDGFCKKMQTEISQMESIPFKDEALLQSIKDLQEALDDKKKETMNSLPKTKRKKGDGLSKKLS